MSRLTEYLVANPPVMFGLSVVLQVSIVTIVALVISRVLTKNSVVRWWIMGAALSLVLASPLTTYFTQKSNVSWLKLTYKSVSSKATLVSETSSPHWHAPTHERPFVQEQPVAASRVEYSIATEAPKLKSDQPLMALDKASPVAIQPTPITQEVVIHWGIQLMLCIWILGTVILLTKMAGGWRMIASLIHQSNAVEDGPLADCLSTACNRVALTNRPRLLLSRSVQSPMAAGIFRSTILLPEELPDVIDEAAMCDVLTHEAAHIARHDPFVALMQNLTSCMFWFHPLVRIVNRDLARAREEICDNYVLRATAPTTYSRTLLRLAESMMPHQEYPIAVGMLDNWKLEYRVADLLNSGRNRETAITGRSFIGVSAVVAVLIAIGWLGTINIGHADDTASTTTLVAKPDKQVEPVVEKDDPSVPKPPRTEFRFAGKVVDAEGKPVEGAKVHFAKRNAKVLATSNAAGKFEFTCLKAELPNGAQWGRLKFVATAEGHGLGIVQGLRFEATGKGREDLQARNPNKNFDGLDKFKPILRMKRSTIPIRGRIVDLEGNPVPDVTMQVRIVDNTYARFAFAPVKTDADGRFEIQNIGDGRTLRLVAKGKDTAFSVLFARTDRKKTETKTRGGGFDPFSPGTKEPVRNRVIYGANFTHAVGPSVPVEGIVTDRESGEPIVGANVYVYRLPNNDEYDRREEFFCTTDEKGHYRLDGLPVGSSGLYATPPKDTPYLPAGKQISIAEDSESTINGDFKMTRGILLRGQVVNGKTGKGVQGFVDYSAKDGNEYYKKAKGFQQTSEMYKYATDIDGNFQLPVLPGAGYVAFHARGGGYTTGILSKEATEDLGTTPGPFLPTKPVLMIPGSYHYVQKIDLKFGNETNELKIDLSPGHTVKVNIFDSKRKRVKNVEVQDTINYLAMGRGFTYQAKAGTYKMEGYTPVHPRVLVLRQRAKNLAATVRYDKEIKGDVTVTLKKAGTIKGRVVTKAGEPRIVTIDGYERPFETDDDGRFQLSVVPAGVPVRITARVAGMPIGFVVKDESVEEGETKNLGDLVVKEFGQ